MSGMAVVLRQSSLGSRPFLTPEEEKISKQAHVFEVFINWNVPVAGILFENSTFTSSGFSRVGSLSDCHKGLPRGIEFIVCQVQRKTKEDKEQP